MTARAAAKRKPHLSRTQVLALEAVNNGSLDYAHPRTVHSLIARGLIVYLGSGGDVTDGRTYRITPTGEAVVAEESK